MIGDGVNDAGALSKHLSVLEYEVELKTVLAYAAVFLVVGNSEQIKTAFLVLTVL